MGTDEEVFASVLSVKSVVECLGADQPRDESEMEMECSGFRPRRRRARMAAGRGVKPLLHHGFSRPKGARKLPGNAG